MAETGTIASFEPSRRMDPFPNCFSICVSVIPRFRERSFSSIAMIPYLWWHRSHCHVAHLCTKMFGLPYRLLPAATDRVGDKLSAMRRRAFLGCIAAGAARLRGLPLNLAPGLQLWTVRDNLAKDEQATLHKIAAIGYRELEHYEMPAAPAQFRRHCEDAGLRLVGSHLDMPLPQFGSDQTIEGARQMGLHYMIVVFPTLRSLSGPNP